MLFLRESTLRIHRKRIGRSMEQTCKNFAFLETESIERIYVKELIF